MNKQAVTEGLLFVVGEEGLTLSQMMDILEIELDEAREILMKLKEKYEREDSGVRLSFLGNTLKLTTKKEHKEYYQKLIENPESNSLSQAALETLAIIAYNEPVTRLEVDEIRGVGSSQVIRKLVAKNLIKEVGRSDAVGRPILYKTTSDFLDFFGLSTIEDLPKIEVLSNVKKESEENVDLYQTRYQEENQNSEVFEEL